MLLEKNSDVIPITATRGQSWMFFFCSHYVMFAAQMRRGRGKSISCDQSSCDPTLHDSHNFRQCKLYSVVLQPRYSKTKQCITCQKGEKRSIFGIKLFVIELVALSGLYFVSILTFDLRPPHSTQFIFALKRTFVPNFKKFHQGVLEISYSQEWDLTYGQPEKCMPPTSGCRCCEGI